jgi:IS6 family transposase
MVCKRAALFRGRHFTDEIIVLCVRWYLRYSLSYRDLTEMMCERNLLHRSIYDLEMGAALRAGIE